MNNLKLIQSSGMFATASSSTYSASLQNIAAVIYVMNGYMAIPYFCTLKAGLRSGAIEQ